MQDRILPVEDLEVSQFAKKQFENKGIKFFLNSNFKVLEKNENLISISVERKLNFMIGGSVVFLNVYESIQCFRVA